MNFVCSLPPQVAIKRRNCVLWGVPTSFYFVLRYLRLWDLFTERRDMCILMRKLPVHKQRVMDVCRGVEARLCPFLIWAGAGGRWVIRVTLPTVCFGARKVGCRLDVRQVGRKPRLDCGERIVAGFHIGALRWTLPSEYNLGYCQPSTTHTVHETQMKVSFF
jgi:hypothetical protein